MRKFKRNMRNLHRRSTALAALAGAAMSLLWAASLQAAPPYDITVTFSPPVANQGDGYNLYVDDCAATGAVAAPFSAVTSGQTFVGALTTDGTFDICVRAFNNKSDPAVDLCPGDTVPDPAISICELPDPGPGMVATVTIGDLVLPNPAENLDVQVTCPNGGCTVTVTVN